MSARKDTLSEARAHVEANLKRGTGCPCCGQFCRLYKRALDGQMAAFLLDLVRLQEGDGWVNIKKVCGNDKKDARHAGGQFSKLVYFGLIEEKSGTTKSGRTSGYWRPTELGVRFSKGRVKIPSHAFVYDNNVVGFGSQPVSLSDVLEKRFRYRHLMDYPSGPIIPTMAVK